MPPRSCSCRGRGTESVNSRRTGTLSARRVPFVAQSSPPGASDKGGTESPIPDDVVLAAVERAERHRGRSGAPVWVIFEHLAIPRRSRRVRVQIRAPVGQGALRETRSHGVILWEPTPSGRRRLTRMPPVELPESPQHQAWRNARTLAEHEIGRFRDGLRTLLDEATALLNESGTSDLWFDLAERLRLSARRLGSATYCLREWAEPDDEVADLDDYVEGDDQWLGREERQRRRTLRAGRRNTRLWSDSDS